MPTPTPAIAWSTIRAAIALWIQEGSLELDDQHVIWDHQGTVAGGTMPRPSTPYVELSTPDFDSPAHDYVVKKLNTQVFSKTITAVDPTTGKLTIPGHGFGNGDGPVEIASTGTVPGGLTPLTDYWVIVVDANTVQLAATFVETGGITSIYGGNPKTPIAPLSNAGTGTITLNSVAGESVPAGKEIMRTALGLREVTVRVQVFGSAGSGSNPDGNDAMRLMGNIVASLPLYVDMLNLAGVGLSEVGVTDLTSRAHQIDGRVGDLLEPRAVLDLVIYVSSAMSATAERVERVSVTPVATLESGATVDLPAIWVPAPPE